jgi:hypothetical protein
LLIVCSSSQLQSFYCIVLLTTLFVSSCYWQPFPITNTLSTSWSDNVTTFAEALNASLTHTTEPVQLPSAMRVVDRCWCDFSTTDIFEPFNVTHWEYVSVQRMKDDLERKNKLVDGENAALNDTANRNQPYPESTLSIIINGPSAGLLWKMIASFIIQQKTFNSHPLPPTRPNADVNDHAPPSNSNENRALIRREYDLRPHGIGVIVDFGWRRTRSDI